MRRCIQTIDVQADKSGAPQSFKWRRRRYVVTRTLDTWRYVGKWWFGTRQTRRYFRVDARLANATRTFELYQQDDDAWFLLAVQD